MTVTPQVAIEKANQKPKPLTKAQRKIVAERDAVVAAKLPDLEAKFAKKHKKAEPVQTENRRNHGKNGYSA